MRKLKKLRPAFTIPAAAQKSFDGLRFTDLNSTPNFANLNLDTVAADYAGFSAARISRHGNSLFINIRELLVALVRTAGAVA